MRVLETTQGDFPLKALIVSINNSSLRGKRFRWSFVRLRVFLLFGRARIFRSRPNFRAFKQRKTQKTPRKRLLHSLK